MVKHTQTIRFSVFDHFVGVALNGLSPSDFEPDIDRRNRYLYNTSCMYDKNKCYLNLSCNFWS